MTTEILRFTAGYFTGMIMILIVSILSLPSEMASARFFWDWALCQLGVHAIGYPVTLLIFLYFWS